ncbi:MAG: hypothetical protein K8R59_09770 [Thermoanaerobaculales bacterium]|nr:hypothetical protein [Thermoanaerobaculales bacterium]
MNALILLAALTLSPDLLGCSDVSRFGTPFFEDVGREALQETALERLPGPSGLVELWKSGELKRYQKLAILLGGAAFHDPLLLPVYREGLQAADLRIRQAAAYGYRDLIGEEPPDVFNGFSLSDARALMGELDAVAFTLRERPLVEMWLASALAAEGRRPPGWRGVIMKRGVADCLRSVERLAHPEDLGLLVQAYELAENRTTRLGLLRMIERFSLRIFLQGPQGQTKAWGAEVYDFGLTRLDSWLRVNCDLDPESVLTAGFEAIGIRGVQPFEPQGCEAWLLLLDQGAHQWWPLAAGQIYSCGGPAIDFSESYSSQDKNKKKRNRLKAWYGR